MKILVVGAGYLGYNIMKLARDKGIPVIGTSRTPSQDTSMITLDVLKPETFGEIPEDVTHIVYSVSAGSSTEEAYRNAYVAGLSNLITFLRSGDRLSRLDTFVFISSTGVYTENHGGVVTEESSVGGASFRSSVIAEAEDVIKGSFPPDKSLILRLSGIYGPERRSFFNQAMQMSGKDMQEYDTWTNRIHVHDAARACLFLMNSHHGVYNVSDSLPAQKLEVMSYIRRISNLPCFDFSSTLASSGKRISNRKLLDTGFQFTYPSYQSGYKDYL
jgi:nucleoside-diphosphate-sugar epimerase